MRILFILENYYPNIGGVETLFQNLAESLAANGFQVTVLTNKFSSSLKSEELFNGVKIRRLPFYNRYFFTFFALPHAIKYGLQADIIHTTSYNAGIPGFFGGLFSRTKTIITFHEVWAKLWFKLPYFGFISKWSHYLFEKFLLSLPFHKFVAVSNYTAHSLEMNGISAKKIQMIYNGIDYSFWEKSEADKSISAPFRFLYFGRLGISKGLDILLRAVAILSKERKDFHLVLIIPKTPKTLYNEVEKLITDLEIKSFIEIKSNLEINDLKMNIKTSDATIIPSYSEGFCFTAVESVALGIPVISSTKGALKEVVSGKHLNMEVLDSECLAKNMKKALDNEWEFKETIQFPIKESVRKYIKLYQDIFNPE